MRLATRIFFETETDGLKPESVGATRAVIATLPRTEGRQLHETESAIELLFMQFGILFPFAKKVTLPSVPATPSDADIAIV